MKQYARRVGSSALAAENFAWLGFVFSTLAQRHEKNGALAFGVRREEPNHLVIIKREAGGAQALGIRPEIHPAAEDAGFELYGAIPAITKTLQNRLQVRQEKDV